MSGDHDHWKHGGVRVIRHPADRAGVSYHAPARRMSEAEIRGDQLDPAAAQTPGMVRQAAIDHARVGAQKIWAGTVSIARRDGGAVA